MFALLGPNGAGKTTTVRILSTLTRADAGPWLALAWCGGIVIVFVALAGVLFRRRTA